MPLLALSLSVGLLFPYRRSLTEEVRSAFSPPPPVVQYSLPPDFDINKAAQIASKFNFDPDGREKRYMQVAALNLPALVATLPIAIFSKSHDSWSPGGMDYVAWQAVNFTFIGIIFWCLVGRGIDANLRSDIRLKWIELSVAALLFLGFATLLVGWVADGPDNGDHPNIQWFVAGALLWFFLEGTIIAGWIKQTTTRRKLTRLQNV